MTRYIFLVFFFISVVPKSFSQSSLNDFSYVIVPEQWDFLNQKDKYQLNSMAKFLFNKHGFNAFFSQEAPDANRCDGLYAELVKVTAILRTKFVIILKDCNGFEIYRGPQGITKIKEFKKAHQDALRKAFEYFEGMNVNQGDIVSLGKIKHGEIIPAKQEVKELDAVVKEVSSKEELNSVADELVQKLPKSKFSSYNYKGISYLLRKTSEGYSLYEETTTTTEGLLLIGKIEKMSEGKWFFTDTFGNIFKASFDALENLSIQKATTSIVYKRVH